MDRPWIVLDKVVASPAEVIKKHGDNLRDLSAGRSEGERRIVHGHTLDDIELQDAVNVAFKEASRLTAITYDDLEPMTLLRYTVGGEYSWHADNELIDGEGEHRKLSVVIGLNEDYKGGDTEFMWPRPGFSEVVHLKPGNAVVFPSFMYHRARPTLGGERWVIVCWAVGATFR